jgi:hypothetical protein
MNKAILYLE